MAIQVRCDRCGAVGEVADDRAGQHGKCRCGNAIVVPEPATAPAQAIGAAATHGPMQGLGGENHPSTDRPDPGATAPPAYASGPHAQPSAQYAQPAGPYAGGPAPGPSYQPAYGRRAGGPTVLSRRMRPAVAQMTQGAMPGVVQVVRALNLVALVLGGGVFCLMALAVLGGSGSVTVNGQAADPATGTAFWLVVLLFMVATLGAMAWVTWALGEALPAAWTVTMVMLIVGLLGFPIGTIVNGLILVEWMKPETKAWFGTA